MIAALYIDPRGPYPALAYGPERISLADGLVGVVQDLLVDCWDAARDARLCDGPHPVVAHPPCGPWGRLRHLYKGAEHDCAPRAVEQVRRWGGVLEHPAWSLLWAECRLPAPFCDERDRFKWCRARKRLPAGGCISDRLGGYTIEVDQVEWGHVARKRTWLYLVGVPREALEAPPFPGREPTHYASGGRTKSSRNGGAVPADMKVCSAQQRRRTPPLFAEYLVRLAQSVKR